MDLHHTEFALCWTTVRELHLCAPFWPGWRWFRLGTNRRPILGELNFCKISASFMSRFTKNFPLNAECKNTCPALFPETTTCFYPHWCHTVFIYVSVWNTYLHRYRPGPSGRFTVMMCTSTCLEHRDHTRIAPQSAGVDTLCDTVVLQGLISYISCCYQNLSENYFRHSEEPGSLPNEWNPSKRQKISIFPKHAGKN